MRLNRVLLEELARAPPSRREGDAELRDYYDRALWLGEGMPLVPVPVEALQRLFRSRLPLALAVVELWRRAPYLRSQRDIAEELQVGPKLLRRVLPELRAYHLFRIDAGLQVVGGPRYVRVPPGGRARLCGVQPVAWVVDDAAIESELRQHLSEEKS